MSVGDDSSECPLCMEPLEPDDVNFFPCTCGYQICRFCWHRIRTDENGLCPACRKQYPEDPAEFKPLTDDEVQNIKKERKLKENQRKQKAAESRKHLANVRVVQRNLVFVVGLSPRLADPEMLKRYEYFGKFGKIHKVVINQSTSYAGSQGPSASAYVTYVHAADALRAIINVNNVHIDGRTLKTSLGTTKYCSHFLRSSQCTKPDCMYLHELGEEAASFTKEEMTLNKHQEYEAKLLEQFINSQNNANNHTTNIRTPSNNKKTNVITAQSQQQTQPAEISQHSPPLPTSNKRLAGDTAQGPTTSDAWPSLQPGQGSGAMAGSKPELLSNGSRSSSTNSLNRTNTPPIPATNGSCSKTVGNGRVRTTSESQQNVDKGGSDGDSTSDSPLSHARGLLIQENKPQPPSPAPTLAPPAILPSLEDPTARPHNSQPHMGPIGTNRRIGFPSVNLSNSFFSNSMLGRLTAQQAALQQSHQPESFPPTDLPESIPAASTEDWSSAFGFQTTSMPVQENEDDLDFDPCTESLKGFQALIENGRQSSNSTGIHYSNSLGHDQHSYSSQLHPHMPHGSVPSATSPPPPPQQHNLPPGFSHTYLQHQQQQIQQQFYHPEQLPNSRMLEMLNFSRQQQQQHQQQQQQQQQPRFPPNLHNNFHHPGQDSHHHPVSIPQSVPSSQSDGGYHVAGDSYDMTGLQQQMQGMQEQLRSMLPNVNISFGSPPHTQMPSRSQHPALAVSHPASASDSGWLADPAIVTTNLRSSAEEPPHWMNAIHQLTETDGSIQNSRFSFAQQLPPMGPGMWPQQMQNPPPGFRNPMRSSVTEAHKLAEALQ